MTTPETLRFPATYYQRDWVRACRDAVSHYSTPVAWDLHGPLDQAALSRALAELVRRHDALRTAFEVRHGDVEQVVWPDVDMRLRPVDLAGTADPDAEVDALVVRETERPRVLDTPPLWHALLLRLGPARHVLAMFIHHLVFDGWSHGVLHDELVRCLRATASGRSPRLPGLPLRVGELARQERSLRDADRERWWRENLRSLPPLAAVPPVGGRFVSRELPPVPPRSTEALHELARRHGVGFNAALLAAVVAVRRRLVGDDVVIGVTRAGRDAPESRRVVGPLLDHVPVRVDTAGATTVGSLLQRVHRAYREATARRLPLGLIRQVVDADLDARGGRLFDTRYNYLPGAASGVAEARTPDGPVRIAARGIDPVRLAPPHTEDHPEVLPLSYILRRQPDGQVTGELCGHDAVHPAAALAELAGELATTLQQLAAGGGRLPGAG